MSGCNLNWRTMGFWFLLLDFTVRAAPLTNLPPTIERLPRTNLMLFHDRFGQVQSVRSTRGWQKRRAEILKGMQLIMGNLPGKEKRCPLALMVETEQDCGSYVCRSISYASDPSSRVPAFLLVPKAALAARKRYPGILALHPTDMEFGRRVVVEPLRSHYPPYAKDLAERGFVVLAPAYPLMADYQPDLRSLGYESGTLKAVWDNMRGLDLLESLPFVKRGGFGAIGHSLGGHNAIFTAVFDARIKVLVSSCGFDSFADYMGGDIKGWTSARYMPRLMEYQGRLEQVPFDFHELIGALAPRKVLVSAPNGDTNFKAASVDEIVRAARPIYELYGAGGNLRVEHPRCSHEFPPEMRQAAYALLESVR